jgi:sphingomyelin phosphodiesterase acid-like 3
MLPAASRIARFFLPLSVALTMLAGYCQPMSSQTRHKPPQRPAPRASRIDKGTFPALFVSDIHFDPFHDPGKAEQLGSASVGQWKAILSAAPSADQQRAFNALQKKCGSKGVDTPFALLASSLAAMKTAQPDSRFMVISGDLVVHDFACRYQTLFPKGTPADYQAFVLKTISFVSAELRTTFPGMPVFTALGNNDSGCVDYWLDPGSEFFMQAGAILSAGMPAADAQSMAEQFAREGNYSLTMPPPMKNTRLVVLNDTFLSPKYKTCAGKQDPKGAAEEINWLKMQLQDARKKGQRVWVVGHIPPGIDPYATAERFKDVCGGEDPVGFLTTNEMPDLMVEYADVIKLGVFAHTHMDEIRLLEPSATEGAPAAPSVAVKMIPAISPVHDNKPSFTIAIVNAETSAIQDFTVIAASNETGEDAKWSPEYSFDRTYHQTEFSPTALKELIGKFRSDNLALLPESESYLRNYYVGDRSAQLSPFWPQYVCALKNYTTKGYAECVCRTGQ